MRAGQHLLRCHPAAILPFGGGGLAGRLTVKKGPHARGGRVPYIQDLSVLRGDPPGRIASLAWGPKQFGRAAAKLNYVIHRHHLSGLISGSRQ
jgi:hypothetical protein